MTSRDAILRKLLREFRPHPNGDDADGAPCPNELLQLLEHTGHDPVALARAVLETRLHNQQLQQNCAQAAEAAEGLQKLFQDLVDGTAQLCRLESVRMTDGGPRAICRVGNSLREMSVHPSVEFDQLSALKPWEFVRVREDVVVGIWVDDPYLKHCAHGDAVTFQGYVDEDRRLARVLRHGQVEEVVRICDSLERDLLGPRCKLVLMRDNPGLAINLLPAEQSHSRFEVPIDTIETRLSDLAGIETLAETLMLEIYKRVISPQLRAEFDLDPLRGMLLSSYKPGMGKTAFIRAFARWLHELGQSHGFDVVLYLVKPNEFKSMWHGEDARIVREDLFGAIRARQMLPRTRTLVQLLVLDEVDSLGRRPEAREAVMSSAQSDALQALLVELDGMVQQAETHPPAHLLAVGMTNRPDRIDDAIKRPGRMGDLVVEMPELDLSGAVSVCEIYTRAAEIPWYVDDEVLRGLDLTEIGRRFLRPALTRVFPAVVLRYSTENQRKIDVRAGDILAAVHYRRAMSLAKNRAADRRISGMGVPAVGCQDLVEGLLDMALSVAAQMEADPQMLIRHLRIKTPVARIDVTPREELSDHRFQEL